MPGGLPLIATVWDTAAQAPWSFLIGAAVGFIIGASFTITRRKGGEDDD